MEVGQQDVDDLEREVVRGCTGRCRLPSAPCAAVSSARSVVVPTATTRRACPAGGHGGGRDAVVLAVHVVILGPRRGHRPERAETDGELDRRHLTAPCAAAVEHRAGQVEAGGGGGHRLGLVGVHGLVAVRIGEGPADVGRQGDGADAVEQVGDAAGVDQQPDQTAPVGDPGTDLDDGAVIGPQHGPGRQAPARADEGGPLGGVDAGVVGNGRRQQQDLGAGRRSPCAAAAGRAAPGWC